MFWIKKICICNFSQQYPYNFHLIGLSTGGRLKACRQTANGLNATPKERTNPYNFTRSLVFSRDSSHTKGWQYIFLTYDVTSKIRAYPKTLEELWLDICWESVDNSSTSSWFFHLMDSSCDTEEQVWVLESDAAENTVTHSSSLSDSTGEASDNDLKELQYVFKSVPLPVKSALYFSDPLKYRENRSSEWLDDKTGVLLPTLLCEVVPLPERSVNSKLWQSVSALWLCVLAPWLSNSVTTDLICLLLSETRLSKLFVYSELNSSSIILEVDIE